MKAGRHGTLGWYQLVSGPSHLFTHPVSGLLPQSPAGGGPVLEGSGASARVPEHSPDASPPSAQVLFALNQTLLQHESVRAGSLQAPYTTEDLIKHYNCGDLNAVIFNHDTSQVRLPSPSPGRLRDTSSQGQAHRKAFIRHLLCARRRQSSLQPR